MSNRFLASFLMPSAAAAIAFAFLATTPAVAQTGSTALFAKEGAKTWTPPRTPDGVPDLQGIYTNSTAVPLERPNGLGAKEFYTKEEAEALVKKAEETHEVRAPGTYGDVHYSMAQFGLEKGQNAIASSVRTSLITGSTGRVPDLLPEARQRQAAKQAANRGHEFDGPENRGLSERCIFWGNEGPPMLPVGYNSNLQIVQGKGYVAIMQEMIHDVRIIPTDGRTHAPSNVRSLMGDSVGHWEGDTLMVDTTNFEDRTAFRGSSENLHVVERFTRTGPNTVLYQFTVEDPHTWAQPWSAEVPMTSIQGPLFEYACHEGNYGMPNNLSGARAEERAAAPKK